MPRPCCYCSAEQRWAPLNLACLVVPRRCPALLLPCPLQIVVGMLLKYTNLSTGWRHRLFVLQDGVLRYYKVRGRAAPRQR